MKKNIKQEMKGWTDVLFVSVATIVVAAWIKAGLADVEQDIATKNAAVKTDTITATEKYNQAREVLKTAPADSIKNRVR